MNEDIKKLCCIHLADIRNNEKLCNAIEEVKFLNKVIDMMAKDIFNGFILNFNCIEQAKEYYFKKARGKEDVKN